jgi:hypothetical protein
MRVLWSLKLSPACRRGPILGDGLGHGVERHERFLTGWKLGNHKAASRESQSCIVEVRLVFVVTV